jgi:DNA topoisomerase-3
MTKAPPHYTEASLLHAMEHAGRQVSDKELAAFMEKGGLGTSATRGAIIKRLIHSEYLLKKARQVRATPKGAEFIDQVDPELKDPALTAERERELSEIEHGRMDAAAFDRRVEEDVRRLVAAVTKAAPIARAAAPAAKTLGRCRKCTTGEIRAVRTKTGLFYGCSEFRNGCTFQLPGMLLKREIPEKHVVELLVNGRTSRIHGFKSKNTGKKFDAHLRLDDSLKVAFDF